MQWAKAREWRLLLIMFFLLSTVTNCTMGAQSLLSSKRSSEIRKKYGKYAVARVEAGLQVINRIQDKSDLEKLTEVNKFANKVRYTTDQVAWGKKDYWAKPIEFLGIDKGDCEDFVITKYFMLRKAGVPEEKLYFTYVKALKYNEAHMVLSYYETPKSIPLILDSINFNVLPASKRKDLAFVYSFNAKELYLNRQKGLGKIVPGGRDKNKKWASFLENIEKEFL